MWLERFSASDNPNQHHHDSYHQKGMNESAKHVATDQSQKPQNQKNDKNGPEHMVSFRTQDLGHGLLAILLRAGQEMNKGFPVFLRRKNFSLRVAFERVTGFDLGLPPHLPLL